MTQIVFYTPTILPKACLFTMGVSAKETEHPIGFFGTGLKYAIAVCMRLGAHIEVFTSDPDMYRVSFAPRHETVRNKDFSMIDAIMFRDPQAGEMPTSQRMPMTLDYGKTWEPWMALRELYSNTVDEKGEMWTEIEHEDDDVPPRQPRERKRPGTYITVTAPHDHDLITAWDTRYDTWLLDPNRTPVWENSKLQVYMRPSSVLFYKGIRVSQGGFESAVTYNLLKDHVLTEDRTLDMWDFHYGYQDDILKINKRDVAKRILEASSNAMKTESKMYLNRIGFEGSEQMREEALRVYRNNPDLLSSTAKTGVQAYIRKHNFDELYTAAEITQEEQDRYDECLRILYDAGFQLHKYKIRISDMDDDNVKGLADSNTNTIVLNVKLLRLHDWKEWVCVVLMEEYVHLEFSVDDYGRTMQTKLLELMYDVITKRTIRSNDSMLAGLAQIANKS
jgi:hypothetical protein